MSASLPGRQRPASRVVPGAIKRCTRAANGTLHGRDACTAGAAVLQFAMEVKNSSSLAMANPFSKSL